LVPQTLQAEWRECDPCGMSCDPTPFSALSEKTHRTSQDIPQNDHEFVKTLRSIENSCRIVLLS
jgi:hypothetical protein